VPNYNEQMQNIWKKYEEAGMPVPAQARDVAAWAIQIKKVVDIEKNMPLE
jgi:hypothetical protein